MKKISVFFIAGLICFSAFFDVYSINIDGYDKGSEWDEAESQLILNGESNCKVNFGFVKWIIDSETNNVYLCVLFREPEIPVNNLKAGFSVQVDGSEPFVISVESGGSQYDVDKYYFEGAVKINDNSGITCEVRIGMKYGLPNVINTKIRFYDSDGAPSNIYNLSIVNSETTTIRQNVNDDYNNEKYTTVSSGKTTSDNNRNTSATQKVTTTRKSNRDEANDNWGILDILLMTEATTKSSQHTSKQSTTAKTTKRSNSKNNKVSMHKSEVAIATETSVAEATVKEVSLTELSELKTSVVKPDTYKVITIIAGGLSLVLISVLGTLKSRKDNNDENDRNS